jgi:hypothetical protein
MAAGNGIWPLLLLFPCKKLWPAPAAAPERLPEPGPETPSTCMWSMLLLASAVPVRAQQLLLGR